MDIKEFGEVVDTKEINHFTLNLVFCTFSVGLYMHTVAHSDCYPIKGETYS